MFLQIFQKRWNKRMLGSTCPGNTCYKKEEKVDKLSALGHKKVLKPQAKLQHPAILKHAILVLLFWDLWMLITGLYLHVPLHKSLEFPGVSYLSDVQGGVARILPTWCHSYASPRDENDFQPSLLPKQWILRVLEAHVIRTSRRWTI